MSLFHSPKPESLSNNAQAALHGHTTSLRKNLHSHPLTFLGASMGLLVLLGIKILLFKGGLPAKAPNANLP